MTRCSLCPLSLSSAFSEPCLTFILSLQGPDRDPPTISNSGQPIQYKPPSNVPILGADAPTVSVLMKGGPTAPKRAASRTKRPAMKKRRTTIVDTVSLHALFNPFNLLSCLLILYDAASLIGSNSNADHINGADNRCGHCFDSSGKIRLFSFSSWLHLSYLPVSTCSLLHRLQHLPQSSPSRWKLKRTPLQVAKNRYILIRPLFLHRFVAYH